MKSRILKLLFLVILPLIPFMGVSNAQFYDVENSPYNNLSAASLDFELQNINSSEQSELFFDQKLRKDTDISKAIKVINTGSLNFDYWPHFEYKNGSQEACEALTIKAVRDGNERYDGPLIDFDLASSSAQLTGVEDTWEFQLNHQSDDEDLQGEYCSFAISFVAHQNAELNSGFFDTEELSNKITIAYEPNLLLVHNMTTHTFSLKLTNLSHFISFDYEVQYLTDTIQDGFIGSEILSNNSQKTIEKYLGTCSSNGTCTPYSNPHNFEVYVDLVDIDGYHIVLEDHH